MCIKKGRLAVVRYGPHADKVVTIVDLIDLRRVVVDGVGASDVSRQQIPIKWLALTAQKTSVQRGATHKVLKKTITKEGTVAKFQGSNWGKKMAAAGAKKSLSDFERFKLMLAKKKVSHAVRSAVCKAKKK